jgi:FkbM family methyltransferase
MTTIESRTGLGVVLSWPVDQASRHAIRMLYMLTTRIDSPVMIDAGACVGIFTVLAGLVPGMRCYAFEPNPEAVSLLWDSIYYNELEDWVTVYESALMDRSGFALLSRPRERKRRGLATLADIKFKSGTSHQVHTVKLDDVIHGKVDVIKLDVEGAELSALEGGRQLIAHWKPAILAETQDKRTRQFGYDAEMVSSLLRDWGYKSQTVTQRDTFFWHKRIHDPTRWFNDKEHKRCLRFTQS